MIITHANIILDVFTAVGFDASANPDVRDFGMFFTLNFDANRVGTLEESTYGIAESSDNVPWPEVPAFSTQPFIDNPQCSPSTFYIFRHSERFFAAAGNGADDSQEILSPEGFVRARALRDRFISENIPVDAIFVSDDAVRSYLTAAPLEAVLDVPVRRYTARSPNSEDLAIQVANMDPCPEHAMIITHGNFIDALFSRLGADVSNILDITEFGFVFTMDFQMDAFADIRPPGIPHVTETTYGVEASDGDVQLFVTLDPDQVICQPTTFYVLRHAERFVAINGNGADDSQEILTPEGLSRAEDLRQKIIDEQLPVDEFYVTQEFIRTLQTAAPTIDLKQRSVVKYLAADPAGITDIIANRNPCPDNVMVVTHGDIILDVFTALGFDASGVADATDFGKFFILTFDENRQGTLVEETYGPDASNDNVPFPGQAPDVATNATTGASGVIITVVIVTFCVIMLFAIALWYGERRKKQASKPTESYMRMAGEEVQFA